MNHNNLEKNFSSPLDYLALTLCILTAVLWAAILIIKYYSLSYFDWDLAIANQSMWQLLRGSTYSSILDFNLTGSNCRWGILPLYALIPHPLTLVMLKVFCFVWTGWLIYLVAKEKLDKISAIIFMFLYFTFPANIFSMIYEFAFEGLAPPFLVLLIYSFKKRKTAIFWLAAVILILIKENLLLIVTMIGFLGLFRKGSDRLKWGFLPIIVSLLFLFLLATNSIPFLKGVPQNIYMVRYQHLGNGAINILSNLILHPHGTFNLVFSKENIDYLSRLFTPAFSVFPLVSPEILFLMLPVLGGHLLSGFGPEKSILYHYGASMVPFIILAGIESAGKIKKIFSSKPKIAQLLVAGVFGMLFISHVQNTLGYTKEYKARTVWNADSFTFERWALLKQIPAGSPVIATFSYMPELSNREKLYSFHKVFDDEYQVLEAMKHAPLNTGRIFVVPDDVRYAIVDYDDFFLQAHRRSDPKKLDERINDFLAAHSWRIIGKVQNSFLYFRE
ncbi:MAG: DUF2079 domain-containing protein [Candidatus Omnitrophica bacterium]|nr:DUF2079 domain-containing protein [Candidatus Omnitrophota bacterium]